MESYLDEFEGTVAMLNKDLLKKAMTEAGTGEEASLLRATALEGGSSTADCFKKMLKDELRRLTEFVSTRQESLVTSARSLLTECLDQQGSTGTGDATGTLRQRAEELVQESLALERFVGVNREVLLQVVREADTPGCAAYESFLIQRLDSVLVVILSDIFGVIRSLEVASVDDSTSTWKAPSTFERTTHKFWVEDKKLTELLLTCAREAPLLVYGHTGQLSTKAKDLWKSSASRISSVYFDSPDMAMYKERIQRFEGAQLFRVRWYGSKKPKGQTPVFLELKTHHEKWVDSKSKKERVTILEKDMMKFLARNAKSWTREDATNMVRSGNPSLEEGDALDEAVDLLLTMRELVLKKCLCPCVRSAYYRVAFQSPKSNSLRLTVDRNITLIDERSAYPKSWCLPDDTQVVENNMIVKVPYSVFELKLAGSVAPAMIEQLQPNGVIIDAMKFSKFLTGAAAFNKNNINMLPYWANHPAFAPVFHMASSTAISGAGSSSPTKHLSSTKDCQDITSRTASASDLDLSLSSSEPFLENSSRLFRRRRSSLDMSTKSRRSSTLAVAPKRPARVEPKSHFANERTFIQWISAALLLVTIAAILLDFQSSHSYPLTAGFILMGCAALIVVYAIFTYFRRIKLLTSGSSYGYVDKMGPSLLGVAVLAGIVVMFIFFLSQETDLLSWIGSGGPTVLQSSTNGECYQHDLSSVSPLEYQASDVFIDNRYGFLLVPSDDLITGIRPRSTTTDGTTANDVVGGVTTLIEIEGVDLEAVTNVEDRIFVVSEDETFSLLIELEWSPDGSYAMNEVQRWTLPNTPGAEALAYEPPKSAADGKGYLYVSADRKDTVDSEERGAIDRFRVPPRGNNINNSTVMTAPPKLGRHMKLNRALTNKDLKNSKIGSMTYFEGVLYVLHDNARVVRAWDTEKGRMLSEWKLPLVGDGANKQWEGMSLQRGSRQAITAGGLRGSSNDDSELLLHLSLDTPAQVWTLKVSEGSVKGEIILPDCAPQ